MPDPTDPTKPGCFLTHRPLSAAERIRPRFVYAGAERGEVWARIFVMEAVHAEDAGSADGPDSRSSSAALRLLGRLTARVRKSQLAKLIASRSDVFQKMQDIPERLQLLTNQVRLVFELIEDYWQGSYTQVRWYSLAVAVAAALYFVSPSDLIPDYLPAVGMLDDLLVIGIAVRVLKRDLLAYCRHRDLRIEDYFPEEKSN